MQNQNIKVLNDLIADTGEMEFSIMEDLFSLLVRYAYKIVGSYEDASDLVQDAFEKYLGVDRTKIKNEKNYLIKMVINLSLNFKNKNNNTLRYGAWSNEPVDVDRADSNIIKEQIATFSMKILFERLNAMERAIFILREGFDYKHDEVAATLDITTQNSRKIYSRTKAKIRPKTLRYSYENSNMRIQPFLEALKKADTNQMEYLLRKETMN